MEFFAEINNTCHDCGVECKGVYAKNRDEARAGQGKCAECAGVEKKEPRRTGEMREVRRDEKKAKPRSTPKPKEV